jgi:hypothetical protein
MDQGSGLSLSILTLITEVYSRQFKVESEEGRDNTGALGRVALGKLTHGPGLFETSVNKNSRRECLFVAQRDDGINVSGVARARSTK